MPNPNPNPNPDPHQVRGALVNGFPLVMVHENDEAAGGCEFAHFFVTTPQDLIADGLYTALAHAWFPAPFRAVSVALVAQAFGADPNPNPNPNPKLNPNPNPNPGPGPTPSSHPNPNPNPDPKLYLNPNP